jgi:DNA invertase Pin-like site-specific DNA recombinase
MRVGVYARVSTHDQTAENQLIELRRYVAARGWSAVEYVDEGVSGAKDRRPALDQLVADVRRHQVQAVVCWRLDRLGRNLRHLVMLLDDWHSRGIAFVTLGEGIDTSTPAGRLVAGVLGSIAEFERARIQERVRAGLARVRAQGRRLGRKPCVVSDERFAAGESLHAAGRPAPRRLAYGGRSLARCKQDPSGTDRGNP